MFKMSYPGQHHRHVVFVAIIHRIGIPDGTPGLNYRRDTCLVSNLNRIGKREKRIRSHHRTCSIESEGTGFYYSLPEGIHPEVVALALLVPLGLCAYVIVSARDPPPQSACASFPA